ncbi:MAG: hypothetical protein ABWY04_09620 [Arthrobacter sp.]
MDTIPAVLLILGTAIAWLGLTVFVLLRLRHRRSGSSVVASAPDSVGGGHTHKPWRRARRSTGKTPAGRRRPGVRKVRG